MKPYQIIGPTQIGVDGGKSSGNLLPHISKRTAASFPSGSRPPPKKAFLISGSTNSSGQE